MIRLKKDMDLKEYCYSLSKDELFKLAIRICEASLFIWNEHTSNNKTTYRDSVVGMNHTIRPGLLLDTIQYCKNNTIQRLLKKGECNRLLEEFTDPIVSLQDFDWELPYPVQQIFYAIYNLLNGIDHDKTIFDEKTHYVAINQAVDALTEDGTKSIAEIQYLIYNS